MSAGFVKIRRGIIDHVRDGSLSVGEFAVFQLLVLMADSSSGSHTINAAVLRSCYFPEMTRDGAQRTLVSLEKKGFIFRLHPASSKRAYKYWINKYEATTGPNKLRRTDLSQVFESRKISDLRWVDDAAEVQTETPTEIPTQIQNSYQEIKKEELSSSGGREIWPMAIGNQPVHVESSSAINKPALPVEPFSLTSSSPPAPPLLSAAATRPRAKTKANGEATDPRHAEFKAALEREWTDNNPELDFQWDASDATALKRLLSGGKLTLKQFKTCLANRSRSENANLGDRPRKFISGITSYSRGPLDSWGKPKSQQQQVTTSSPGLDLARQNERWLEEKRQALEREEAANASATRVAHA